jgi:UDP-N-acetylglucosamine 4-epimerase
VLVNWLSDPRHDDLVRALEQRRAWLVTGAAGFIGSHLVETLLLMDQQVRGLDSFATGHARNLDDVERHVGEKRWQNFELLTGDICDAETCRAATVDVDMVLHQAAVGSVPRSVADPVSTFDSNVAGFLNMLQAARSVGAGFVYASSSAVYGDEENLPKKEARIGKPLSPYAASKLIDELIAEVFWRTYGTGSVGLRYFNVFGRRQDPQGPYAAVIPKWAAAMICGDRVEIYGDGETSRDFCYIDNVVQANLRAALLSRHDLATVYNVAVGDRTTLNELFCAIRASLSIREAPEPVYREFRLGDVRHSQADVTKISSEIGYISQISMADGIKETIGWYSDQAQSAGFVADGRTRQAC